MFQMAVLKHYEVLNLQSTSCVMVDKERTGKVEDIKMLISPEQKELFR